MQIVAQSLLVLRITHGSAFALGAVSLAQASAFFLFALVGGGVADRLDRRRLLLTTQTLLMCFALIMGILTVAGLIQVWIIAALAFLSGAALSFDQPTRAALISSLVPKEDLLNAISLQSAVFNGASIVGPALAGIIVDAIGLPANFFLNAFSFLAVLLGLLSIRSPASSVKSARPKLIAQVSEALGTIKRDTVLPPLLVAYGILLFAGPSLALLLPVLSLYYLHVSAGTLGVLFSASGLGAVLGALLLASSSESANKSIRSVCVMGNQSHGVGRKSRGRGHVLISDRPRHVTKHHRRPHIDATANARASGAAGPRDEHQHIAHHGSASLRRFPGWRTHQPLGTGIHCRCKCNCRRFCSPGFAFEASESQRALALLQAFR
jgi:MFS family permease